MFDEECGGPKAVGGSVATIPVPTSPDRGSSPPADRQGSILDASAAELEAFLADAGQPPYRLRQIERWINLQLVFDFDRMADLPTPLRSALAERYRILPVVPVRESVSDGGLTRKALLRLGDGITVECVLMVYPPTGERHGRRTICVSSQAGCGIGCPFCATGRGGLRRNLTIGEIVGQVLHLARRSLDLFGPEAQITNVVFMGQGEPLANFPNVWRAIEQLNAPGGFGLGARHMTLSTSGLVPRIRELAERELQVGLAVSLHAPTDDLRDILVPVNRKYPIAELLAACREYVTRTRRRVSFEYAMMDGINDSPKQARRLADLLAGLLAHANLIPLNRVDGSPYQPTPWRRIVAFQDVLCRAGVPCTVRTERGDPIDAACGQLRTLSLHAEVARHEAGRGRCGVEPLRESKLATRVGERQGVPALGAPPGER
ncbi:MAG: 23S rRNA (adenine(2503)-C(2))-methyltransferase RlmN [Chloroflexi bacterium]|nr:23S rRNA (adenine(2503)-C(2))-methyltransferase RlmN [Chloroflexota bacterium]